VIVDLINLFMLVTIGFVKTFGAMEAAWRTGKRAASAVKK
jgi:hypothetical protein